MAQRRDVNKQQRWLNLVRLWQKSQFTVREFCRRRNLSEPSFHAWRRVLRERGLLHDTPMSPAPVSSSPAAAAFVEVDLDTETASTSAIEVVLSERRLLRVRPDFDSATLLQLVRLLEEPAC